MTTEERRIRLIVYGHVQGVGFRWWTRREANGLHLAGTVRNLADGTVEIEAQGAGAALDRLRAWAAEGPPGARVERVEEAEPGAGRLPSPFEIER